MTGLPEFNYPAFFKKEEELVGQGYSVENPARNSSIDDNGAPKTWKGFIIDALHQLEQCTHIHFLPGWENSKGAQIEALAAAQMGLKTLEL
jgi:hypothetical protein